MTDGERVQLIGGPLDGSGIVVAPWTDKVRFPMIRHGLASFTEIPERRVVTVDYVRRPGTSIFE